jgi:hypothetical protein
MAVVLSLNLLFFDCAGVGVSGTKDGVTLQNKSSSIWLF